MSKSRGTLYPDVMELSNFLKLSENLRDDQMKRLCLFNDKHENLPSTTAKISAEVNRTHRTHFLAPSWLVPTVPANCASL